MRARAALVLSVAAVVVALVAGGSEGYPLVLVPQGLSTVVEGDRAFLHRTGTLQLTAYARRSPAPGGGTVVWCPRERVFFDGETNSLWDEQGRYAFGPAPRDLDTYRVRVSERALVSIDRRLTRAKGRSKGRVDRGVFGFFQRYLNRESSPLNPDASKRLVWCPDPLT